MSMQIRPLITEKAVIMIESQNTLTFKTEKDTSKTEIKKEVEEIFKVKIAKIRALIRGNHKYFYVKLKKDFPAIDVATKIGMI